MPKTSVIWKSISDADASDYFLDILMINASSRKYMKEKCMFIRKLPTTLLEIFFQFMPKARVIWKSIMDPDDIWL